MWNRRLRSERRPPEDASHAQLDQLATHLPDRAARLMKWITRAASRAARPAGTAAAGIRHLRVPPDPRLVDGPAGGGAAGARRPVPPSPDALATDVASRQIGRPR